MNKRTGLVLTEELGKIHAIDLNSCTPEEVLLAMGRLRAFLNIGQASKAPSEKVLQEWGRAKASLAAVQDTCGEVVKSIIEEQQRIEAGETNGAIQITEGEKLFGASRTNGSFLIFGAKEITCQLPIGSGMAWTFDTNRGLYLTSRITAQDGRGHLQFQVMGDRWVLVNDFPNERAPGEWLNEKDLEGITSLHGSHTSAFSPFVTENPQRIQ